MYSPKQVIERKIAQATSLMENMSVQHFLWRSELKKTRRQIASAPGDALITSAIVVYHGPFDDRLRQDLLHEWLDHTKQNAFNAKTYINREPYSVTTSVKLPLVVCPQQGLEHEKQWNISEKVLDSHGNAAKDKVSSNVAQVSACNTYTSNFSKCVVSLYVRLNIETYLF